MSAEQAHAPAGVAVVGGTFWRVVSRSEDGHPTELRRIYDVAEVRNADGAVLGYTAGVHPSRGGQVSPADVMYRPQRLPEPPEVPEGTLTPDVLAALDCYAVAGSHRAAALARWHEDHPLGAQSPAEAIEEHALRAGFVRRPGRHA